MTLRYNVFMTLHSILIPDTLFVQLRRKASEWQRPVADIAYDALKRYLVDDDDKLPQALENEIGSMQYLSDGGLWALASSSLTPNEWEEFRRLGSEGRERELTEDEKYRQDILLAAYDAMVLRRAHAAILLKERGYDISDPSIFS